MADTEEQPGGLGAWWAVREVDHLFSRFGRYTRLVGYGKWALLGTAGLLVVSLIAWPLLTKDKSGLRVSFVDTKSLAQKPSSPVMSNPEYHGLGDSGQQYKLNGTKATQKSSTLVVIDAVEAQMLKANGKWFSLSAERADYQQDRKIADLYGNVTLLDGEGTTFTTSHATIEMNTMDVYGNESISGVGNLGNILASGFEIRDNGSHITFTRGDAPIKVQLDRAAKKK